MARALASDQKKAGSGWWDWHPSKTALEYLWRTGVLAVSRRQAFQKVYDLTENVVPERYRADAIDESTLVDWCCRGALQRLGVATAGEIAAFWGAISLTEAQQWITDVAGTEFPVVTVGLADGTISRPMLADPDVLSAHEDDVAPPGRLRVVSPFDPVIRDRKRALRLFGFDYRIEIFVPASKRKYGYYVFPILEGDRFVGRIDMRCDRDCETLVVTNVWWEPGLRPSRQRQKQLDAELQRVAAFAGCSAIEVNRSLAAG